MVNKRFGDLIAQRRTALRISPEELAKRLGRKSKSVVYDLESGRQDPTVADINTLARELDVSVEELLLALGARLNPREAALLPYEMVQDLLVLHRHPDYWRAIELAVRGLRRDLDGQGNQP